MSKSSLDDAANLYVDSVSHCISQCFSFHHTPHYSKFT